jgi:hypothetical protein
MANQIFRVLKGQRHKAIESKSVEDTARRNSQHLPEKKEETETHSESPINHAKAYVFSEIKRISKRFI